MPFSDSERNGLYELLSTPENASTLLQLAKSFSKNLSLETDTQALQIIFIHGQDAFTILNKKAINKKILFKYLNSHQIELDLNITKAALVAKTLELWKSNTSRSEQEGCDSAAPISEVSKAFAVWFFTKYNSDELVEADFYSDAELILRIAANDGSEENHSNDALNVVKTLNEKKGQFGFFFNLNSTHMGVQGRMDVHGMLLVLSCGTLHTIETCVGVFECVFGLLRDPFERNAWKIKTMRFFWRSEDAVQDHSLNE